MNIVVTDSSTPAWGRGAFRPDAPENATHLSRIFALSQWAWQRIWSGEGMKWKKEKKKKKKNGGDPRNACRGSAVCTRPS
jgi:hypothetical protein